MKDTLKNNKLIAEFMGEHIVMEDSPKHTKVTTSKAYADEDYNYHMRWDWLMPVVEQCKSFCNKKGWGTKSFIDCFRNLEIENTYKAVVEFIKWYNLNK